MVNDNNVSKHVLISAMEARPRDGASSTTESRRRVLSYIEQSIEAILDQLQTRPAGNPSILLRRISSLSLEQGITRCDTQWQVNDREVRYSFPGRSKDDAKRFSTMQHSRPHQDQHANAAASLLRVLVEIYEAIRMRVAVTKR